MSNNLERNIAVIFFGNNETDSIADLTDCLMSFGADYGIFSDADLSRLEDEKFDGILLGDSAAFSQVKIGALEKLLRRFHRDSKPIGAIGRSIPAIASIFGGDGVEVTVGAEGPAADAVRTAGATHTICPATDYVSDRDNKVLTTPGSFGTATDAPTGVQKMLRELVEMA